jgi:hypothetical protein
MLFADAVTETAQGSRLAANTAAVVSSIVAHPFKMSTINLDIIDRSPNHTVSDSASRLHLPLIRKNQVGV